VFAILDIANGKDLDEIGVDFGKKALPAAVSTAAQGLFDGVEGTGGVLCGDENPESGNSSSPESPVF
jgi:hypothetical protein